MAARVYAHLSFEPEELSQRIEALAEYHAKREDDFDRRDAICWGCGRREWNHKSLAKTGWVARVIDLEFCKELYCPKCFKKWGWPDEQRVGDGDERTTGPEI
jgi:predicted nucleic-acid-binding Zn-ribbon protein